ncbi:MAG: hypothetical protein LBS69_07685 [Prevotellaceae bacterium]|nr:hypothetical protein [Prevotellaceae bacterium]
MNILNETNNCQLNCTVRDRFYQRICSGKFGLVSSGERFRRDDFSLISSGERFRRSDFGLIFSGERFRRSDFGLIHPFIRQNKLSF